MREHQVRLEPRPVADFYAEVMGCLAEPAVQADLLPRLVEVPEAIPFPADDRHASYDREYVRRFWVPWCTPIRH
jgi:hypothetical protein